LRELPPTPVTGPTLVYKRAKSGTASFFCSRCGLDFATTDPLEAFQDFARHQHDCASSPRPRKDQGCELAALLRDRKPILRLR
jgi:hypothetical protein